LALFAPIDPPGAAVLAARRPQLRVDHGYRVIDRRFAWTRWVHGIPPAQRSETVPAPVFDAWWQANLATDPRGRGTGTLRAPNRVWPQVETERIRVPVQITRGEWDRECSAEGAARLLRGLTGAAARYLVELEGGSHHMSLERRRFDLYAAVRPFLESHD
jgi:pimeloyl-ACP methyl ester carboxylesterase